MNACTISGYLTHDPELRRTQNGTPVCTFSVGVARPNEKDKTDFIRCYAWRSRAEFIAKHFVKGQRIEVCGPITTHNYEKDGERRYSAELRCDYVNFGERKRETDPTPPDAAADFAMLEDDDSELPF